MELKTSRVMVVGARGMLAGDLIPQLCDKGTVLELTDLRGGESEGIAITRLDITKVNDVFSAVADFKPDWIVNCAAYTNVDAAEENPDIAFAVNGTAVGNLASAAHRNGAALLHMSTDYVFSGDNEKAKLGELFVEEDLPHPSGVYAKSKLYGEELVQRLLPDRHLIVRTSWLHGVHGPNFVDTLLRVGAERDEMRVVDDQVGSPTWAGWLAGILIRLMERDARGVFHATSRGNISWYEFATEIFEQTKNNKIAIHKQSTVELGRLAPRPTFSTLSVKKLEDFLGEGCISWKDGLNAHIAARGEEKSKSG